MKIGLIARMDKTGLGIQTQEIFENLRPHKTLVVDISEYNQTAQHPEWYENKGLTVKFHKGFLTPEAMDWITTDVDVLFSCEIFYGYEVVKLAKERGVKTALQYNAEFLDYFCDPWIQFPDLLLAPSVWMIDRVKKVAEGKARVEYLPLPINRKKIQYKPRKGGGRFLHIAGRETYQDRNGTMNFIHALRLCKNPVKAVIKTQHALPVSGGPNLEIQDEIPNYADLYKDEDVLVLPRKYGGLCLPLNEAMAAGMAILMTNCDPQNSFLRPESLMPFHRTTYFESKTQVAVNHVHAKDIAEKMDYLYEHPGMIEFLSNYSNHLADEWSWENMKPQYLKVLESL